MNMHDGSWKKTDLKKTGDDLQDYLMFQRRGTKEENRNKYNRKQKHKKKDAHKEDKYY